MPLKLAKRVVNNSNRLCTKGSRRGTIKLFPSIQRGFSTSSYKRVVGLGSKKLDLHDPYIFQQKQTKELIFVFGILKSCSFPFFTTLGPKVLETLERYRLSGPAYFLIKQTFFKHFVAGENIKESLKVVSDLKNQGILSILDYSVEAIQDDVDDVVNTIISTIEVSEKRGFACFKMTALTSTHLLLRMSQLIEHSEANPNFKIPWDFPNHSDSMTQVVDRLISASIESTSDLEPNHLNQDELFELRSLCQRMERIADAAMTQQVSVLVDAEQSYYQTAIHFLVRSLYRKYNRGYHPIIYGTYQLYIKSTLDTLKADIENGRKDGYAVGAKLVRGAYMDSEREHALLMGNSDPINDTIEDTHKCYNDAIKILLDEIYQGNGSSIMIATHNEESILYASQLMEERGLASNHEKVYFAQLHAMCNHITLSLSKHGYNSCKYVPFGPLKSVAPYLIRRMVENKGFIGKSNGERELIKAELSRRFSGEQPQPVVDYK